MIRAVERLEVLVYDGTNGDEICAFATPPLIKTSEADGVLVFKVEGFEDEFTVRANDRVMRNRLACMWPMILSAEEYADRFYELPE